MHDFWIARAHQTLAIVLPALWNEKRDTKRAKLQYADASGISLKVQTVRRNAAIAATAISLSELGVPTHLSDYGLDGSSIPALLKKLEEHGMTQLGENHDITWISSRRIYTKPPAKLFYASNFRFRAFRPA